MSFADEEPEGNEFLEEEKKNDPVQFLKEYIPHLRKQMKMEANQPPPVYGCVVPSTITVRPITNGCIVSYYDPAKGGMVELYATKETLSDVLMNGYAILDAFLNDVGPRGGALGG